MQQISEPVFVNVYRAREWIPPAYLVWRAGTTNRVIVLARQAGNRFLDSLKGLKTRAQVLYYKEGGMSFKIGANSVAS
jgi:hypothetical protein